MRYPDIIFTIVKPLLYNESTKNKKGGDNHALLNEKN